MSDYMMTKQDEHWLYNLKGEREPEANVVWCIWQLSGLIVRDFHCFSVV